MRAARARYVTCISSSELGALVSIAGVTTIVGTRIDTSYVIGQISARCVDLCATGLHLTRDGLVEIIGMMQTMNHQKPRRELVRILRDHTPDIQPTLG